MVEKVQERSQRVNILTAEGVVGRVGHEDGARVDATPRPPGGGGGGSRLNKQVAIWKRLHCRIKQNSTFRRVCLIKCAYRNASYVNTSSAGRLRIGCRDLHPE